MKKNTVLSTVLAAMMLATAGNAMAETHLFTKDVKLVKRDTKKVEVKINQPNVGELDVKIEDNEGVVVYAGSLKGGENVSTQFNLNALPNGEYVLSCSNNGFWSSQHLSITNGNVVINENSYQEALPPKVESFALNRFEVTPVVKNVADLAVTITNNEGVPVYDGYLSSGSRFNLGHLPSGNYAFEFTVADKVFKQHVKVK
ncbi:MAG: hypothetical protein U0X91_29190 [Spirosomataceae bacterium]